MDKKLLANAQQKYILFEVDEAFAQSCTIRIEFLFKYIGTHSKNETNGKKTVNKNRKKEHHIIGEAYKLIRARADQLLGVKSKMDKLRVSKQEVKSVRQCFSCWAIRKGNYYQLKIPFKIWHIFKAITLIVEETKKEHPLPDELKEAVGKTYRVGFCNGQIEQYLDNYDRIVTDAIDDSVSRCRCELLNDFESITSPFQEIFGGIKIEN